MTAANKQDSELFEKLRVSNVLELSLIIPNKYDDLVISKTPKINEINVVEIVVQSTQRYSKFFKVVALAWGKIFDIIIFHQKPFHYVSYKVGNRLFIQAKLELSFGKMQFIQPKILNEVGVILPIYKSLLQQKTIRRVMKTYLNMKSFLEAGLDKNSAKKLIDFHNPVNGFNYMSAYTDTVDVLKFVEILLFLKKLKDKKRVYEASAILKGNEKEFIKNLPFTLTSEQQNAILDIKNDLSSKNAARRVIMGDVGSGKTAVIFAAVTIAIPKKSILMAPTTILAEQLFHEAKRLLPKNIKILLVRTKNKNVDLSNIDFIIGTHVILFRDLPKCDLVMIDEQHRFGTAQRDKIHKLVQHEKGKHAHFLQFTATPIPRTLSMIHSSLVKYSFIKKSPFPKDIDTFISNKEDFKNILHHIDGEIKKKRQIAIIYPLVEESEKLSYQSLDEGRGFWEKRYSNVYVTHGKDKNKENILEEFRKNGNILLATTLIEVGISLPKLTTIIIVGAEYLGLATLHQLRGRVSRTGLKGYCYLYTNNKENERLKEFSKTKSGFDIAEIDLKYRQSGDLFAGVLQHGVTFRWFSLKDDKKILERAQKSLN